MNTHDTDNTELLLQEAVTGRSTCRTCFEPIAKAALRIAGPLPTSSGPGDCHHVACAGRRWPRRVLQALEAWPSDTSSDEADLRRVLSEYGEGAHLSEAVTALGDWDAVLTQLARRWFTSRDLRIAELMARLTDAYVAQLDLPAPRAAAAWVDARGPGMLERGATIAALDLLPKSRLRVRLRAAQIEPPDPRWLDLALRWIESSSSFRDPNIFCPLFELLEQHCDERVIALGARYRAGEGHNPHGRSWATSRDLETNVVALDEREEALLEQVQRAAADPCALG